MKILLIIPSQYNVYGKNTPALYPPMGILSLASVLRGAGHDIQVIDMDVDMMGAEELNQVINSFSPKFVGITSTTPTFDAALEICSTIKESHPDLFILMGGIHATVDPEKTLEHKCIDAICIGEGEHTVAELVKALETGKDLKHIPGLGLRVDNEFLFTKARDLESDLSSFPFPAFDLIDLSKYTPPYAHQLPVAPIMSSRGCPGRCTYCCSKQIFGRRFRARTVENIVAEIEELVSKYKVKEIHFLDDNLTTSKKRLLKLCSMLKEKNFDVNYQIPTGIRADTTTPEVLDALKSINLLNIGFGVESGNQTVLNNIKKDVTKDRVREAMKLTKEYDFETFAFFIIGLPGDTPETIKETIDFAIELDPDFAKFVILKPYPGSEIHTQLSQAGLMDSYDYKNYGVYTHPVHHLPDLSADEIVKWQGRAFRRFYLRPSKIIQHLRRMSTLTTFLMVFKWSRWVLSQLLPERVKHPASTSKK